MPEDMLPPEQDGAGPAPAEAQDAEPRTFTQEDVDRLVAERLRQAEQRALVAERLLAKGVRLPLPYLAQIQGDDEASIDAAIDAACEQWAADVRRFARPLVDVGSRAKPAALVSRPTRVDESLADRMRRGEPEAFREYQAMRP